MKVDHESTTGYSSCSLDSACLPLQRAFNVRSQQKLDGSLTAAKPFEVFTSTDTLSLKGEDTFIVSETEIGGREYRVCAVFDGHGGKQASSYCAKNLLPFLVEEAKRTVSADGSGTNEGAEAALNAVGDACRAAFARCHRDIRGLADKAGATATVLVLDAAAGLALCANVGDSLALILDCVHDAFITTSHRLDVNTHEQERVAAAGAMLGYARRSDGSVSSGPLRLWPGGLAMGRSLGDADCGDAILPEPAIEIVEICADATILVCSDGVWDGMRLSTVSALARSGRRGSAFALAQSVTRAALERSGLRDDTTCIAVLLKVGGGGDGGGTHGAMSGASSGISGSPSRRASMLVRPPAPVSPSYRPSTPSSSPVSARPTRKDGEDSARPSSSRRSFVQRGLSALSLGKARSTAPE